MGLELHHLDIDGYSDFSLIGSGGNAKVYRAECGDTDEFVAIKVLFCGGDESVTRRFERERSSMAVLDPLDHVVPVHDSGTTPTGDPYLVMPLFNGGSLKERIDDQPLRWRDALIIGEKVANAVAEAHEMSILHLDIKPGNVLLDEAGEPHLADFGIAETIGSTASMSAQLMTPAYTPPERFDGAKPTEQTDVYGLGGLLFALITGRAPFVLSEFSSPAAMIASVLHDDVATEHLVPLCPGSVVDLVARTLSKNPTNRPSSAAALRDEITEILVDEADRAFDPVVAFRVSSEASQAEQSVAEEQGVAEISGSSGGEHIDGVELVSNPPVRVELSDTTSQPASFRYSSPSSGANTPLVWAVAAALFLAACLAGAVSASIWNSSDIAWPSNGATSASSGSPRFDQISAPNSETATADQPDQDSSIGNPGKIAQVGEAQPEVEVLGEQVAADTDTSNTLAGQAESIEQTSIDEPIVGTETSLLEDPDPDLEDEVTESGEDLDDVPTPAPAPTDEEPPTVEEPEVEEPSPVVTPPPGEKVEEPEVEQPEVEEPEVEEPEEEVVVTTTTIAEPPVVDSLSFEDRIDIGDIGETTVTFRFTTSAATSYQVTLTSAAGDSVSQSGSASAGVLENVTIGGLSAGTDYVIEVTLLGDSPVSATPVSFRTAGNVTQTPTSAVVLQDLRIVSTATTRFELNYESNICANGSFIIRDLAGNVVGTNAGQQDGCTTRHLAVPGFWTSALSPNTTYEITVTVEANGQGLGQGNVDSETIQVTTAP